jgi:hypothetical protein
MTLEAVFIDLSARWQRLVEEIEHGLLWSVTEAKPAEEHALATFYVDTATDLTAVAREGLAAARAGIGVVSNLPQTVGALLQCQERFHALGEQFHDRLASYGRLRHLRRFGREKGGAWLDWAGQVRRALDRCGPPMDDVGRALLGSWQEIADRIGAGAVSVHTTNIGQQIAMSPGEAGVAATT